MKKTLIAMLVGLLLITAGCSTADNTPADSSAPDSAQPDASESPVAENTPVYYGDWKITSSVATSEVYALSQDEIDGFINTALTYSADTMTLNRTSEAVPSYEETTLTAEEFKTQFGAALSDIGIDGEEVVSVSVGIQGNMFGCYFYEKDENTLIVYYEGVFFEAERQ